jgi:hypothetical protein
MKKIILLCFWLSSFTICAIAQKANCKEKGKVFKQHFGILDSIAKNTANDTLTNCQPSIQFMEENTGIEASTDADYFGRFACTKTDLARWHKWYEENCIKKSKQKKNTKIKTR